MLTALQQRIADLFFGMSESADFALAGGAALIARGAIERDTHDLDFFADHRSVHDITSVVGALTGACDRPGRDHRAALADLRSTRDHRH